MLLLSQLFCYVFSFRDLVCVIADTLTGFVHGKRVLSFDCCNVLGSAGWRELFHVAREDALNSFINDGVFRFLGVIPIFIFVVNCISGNLGSLLDFF